MTYEQLRRRVSLLAAASTLLAAGACASTSKPTVDPSVRGATAIERQIQGASSAPRLDHVMPARDSQGRQPTRFEWTAVPGADSYSVGIWNEIDMIVWRMDNVQGTSIEHPENLRLDPGTYFWTVSALRGGEEITASGLAAFVVRPSTP